MSFDAGAITGKMLLDTKGWSSSINRITRDTSKLSNKLQDFQNRYEKNWLATTAKITASIIAIRKVWSTIELGAQAEQQEQAFRDLASSYGANADELLWQLKRTSRGAVSQAQLISTAGKSILLGLAPEKLPKLMEIARASSRITGQTMVQAFEDISTGIARESRMILDNLGIIVKAEDAYNNYAASIGTTANKLTEAQRKQAFLNAVLDSGEDTLKRINTAMLSNAERIQVMKARWNDFAVFSGKMMGAFFGLVAAGFVDLIGSVEMTIGKILKAIIWLNRHIENLLDKAGKLPGKLGQPFRDMSESLSASTDSLQDWADESDFLVDHWNKIANDFAAGAFSMAGVLAEGPRAQLQKLKKEVEAIKPAVQQMAIGWKTGLTSVVEDLVNFKNFGQSIAVDLANGFMTTMEDGIFNFMKSGFKDVGDVAESFGDMILRMVAQIIVKLLVMRALMAIAGPSGQILGVSVGGLVGNQNGIERVPSTGVYKLHEGETVVPRYDSRNQQSGQKIEIYNMLTNQAIANALRSREGQDVVVNIIDNNSMRNGVIRREVGRR